MEGRRTEGPPPPPRKNKNADVLCSCQQPARLVVVPTSWVPGQRCWRCANPDVQCQYVEWHGPWILERNNRDRTRQPAPHLQNQIPADQLMAPPSSTES